MRSAEVWKQLIDLGVTEESKLDFDFHFSTRDKKSVEALKSELADYPLEVSSEGFLKNHIPFLAVQGRSYGRRSSF